VITTLVFLLPAGRLKNFLLRRLGHHLGRRVSIAPCLVTGATHFDIGDDVTIGPLNAFRGLAAVRVGHHAVIGQLNWFSAAATYLPLGEPHGVLDMSPHSTFVSRHYVDCSGGVILEPYALVGGVRSTFLTHQANALTGALEAAPIRVGQYTLVNAHNKLIAGTTVPSMSVTGIGAVVLPGLTTPGQVYAGIPARPVKALDTAAGLFARAETTFGLPIG
jgi:acetyltransferase-like isoleucine patch superfamily enzyme